MRGIPLRVEIGPKDIEANKCVICRRDTREKIEVGLDELEAKVAELLAAMQVEMLERARAHRESHTYVAKNSCSIMSVSKQEIMKLSDEYEIFRINLLNLVCTQSQKNNRRLFRVPAKTLSERLIRFFESHSVRPAGEKIFHIKMTRLAEEMNVKRIYVSKALNELQSEGLIQLQRGRIYIPALENLIKR